MKKIYEFRINGEKEWICANTIFEAIKLYYQQTGLGISDFEETDDIVELPEEKWEEYEIIDEEGNKEQTFKEFMKTALYPELIASTAL